MNHHKQRFISLLLVMAVFALSSCSGNGQSDAYGQFEATETVISSELGGKLLKFQVDEGDNLTKNQQVGLVDTTRLTLKKEQLESELQAVKAKIASINAEVDVQKEQLTLAETNLQRVKALIKDHAATQQKLDQAQAKVRTIKKKIDALQTQKQSIRAQIAATKAGIQQVESRLQDAQIINPINGTVLTTFVEEYEIVRQGQPLYRIAALDTMILQVYVSGAQLPHVKLGEEVEVLVDKNANENYSLTGTITWIASEAEFTPQQIQTKEERVTQVYAVEVRVPNPNGIIKIGMPGEVNF